MLEIRPICEHCARELPPDSLDARICSFECTFCSDCVDNVLQDVCPNCGGGFTPRPVRPARDWKDSNCLANHPATSRHVHAPVDADEHAALVAKVGKTPPARR